MPDPIQNPVEEVVEAPVAEVVEEPVAEIPEAPAPPAEEDDHEAAALQAAVDQAETPEEKKVAQAAQRSAWAKLRRQAKDADLARIEAEKDAAFNRGIAAAGGKAGGASEKVVEPPAYVVPDFLEPRPKEDDFEEYGDFETAKEDWVVKRAQHYAYHQIKAETAEESRRTQKTQAQEQINTWVNKGKEKYADFEQVLNAGPTLPRTVAQSVWDEDNSQEVAYFLAKNPGEMQRIAALPPNRHASEIGKLAYRLSNAPKPKPQTISNAPTSIKPAGGAETEIITELTQAKSMEEYAAVHPLGRKG